MNTDYIKGFILAALTTILLSCVEEDYQKGTPDSGDCMGVYFVEGQVNAKAHSLESDDDRHLDFLVRRTDDSTDEAVQFKLDVYYLKQDKLTDTSTIEVPVAAKSLFETDEVITFAKGQKESTIRVNFERIQMGVTYNCTLTITDPDHVSIYSNTASSLTFSIEVFEWDYAGIARFRDGLISEMFEADGKYLENAVRIEQRRDKPGYFRMKNVYSPSFIARLLDGEKAFEEDSVALKEMYSSLIEKDAYIYLDATDSSKVFFPAQKTGFSYPSLGEIYMTSDVAEGSGTGNGRYGTLSKSGVVTFPKNGVLFGVMGYFYIGNSEGKARVILPDENYRPSASADFGISMTAGETSDSGTVPVTFSLEKDIAKVKYCVFTGKISDIQLDKYIEAVKDADDSQCGYIRENGTYDISFKDSDATGIFTLIACSYDADDCCQDFNSIQLGYVKPGDKKDIELIFEVTANDRYASDDKDNNYSSRNSFQYWIRGRDITRASVSYYPTSFYNTYKERIHKEMKEYGSLTAAALKALNEQELSGVIGNTLTSNTCYTLVIYAENGYQSRFFADTVWTRGEPDYAEKLFYYDDIAKYKGDKSTEAYTSDTWIPVSMNISAGKVDGRTIRGNWRAKTVSIRQEGEQMVLSGLFPSLKTNPDITFDYRDGVLYTTKNTLAKVVVKDSTNLIPSMRFEYKYLPKIGAASSSGDFFATYEDDEREERYDMMAAGFVDEDVIAFTDNRTKFNFWTLILGGYLKDGMGDDYLHNLIGDAHGYPLLVRNNERGRRLIENLKEDNQAAAGTGSVTDNGAINGESGRLEMPKVNHNIFNNHKVSEIEPRLVEFKATKAASVKGCPRPVRLEDKQIATIMR